MSTSSDAMIDNKTKIELLRTMLKIRAFEDKIVAVYPQQEMKTPVHLYIGQEAVAAGVGAHLKREDYIFSTHRNHGHYVAKGAALAPIMAELYGRKTGCAKGKGGSMHFVDVEAGCMGTSAIVGGNIPLAVGAALACKMKNEDRLAVAFFGDGASDEGVLQESLNFAALHKLPVLFVCENNFYATNSHQRARHADPNISKRAAAFGIAFERVDGNDVEAAFLAAQKAVTAVRAGKGPFFLEFTTYRWKGHVGPDCDYIKGCRPKAELDEWLLKCPIKNYKEKLLRERVVAEKDIAADEAAFAAEVEAAWKFGKESPYPAPEEVFDDVYH